MTPNNEYDEDRWYHPAEKCGEEAEGEEGYWERTQKEANMVLTVAYTQGFNW